MQETGLLFATLKVVDTGFNEGTIEVNYLNKEEAIRARQLIQGLVVCHHQQIGLGQFDAEELLKKIEEAGDVKDVEL